MKKLLSLIGVIGLTLTPVMTVISCGETSSKDENKDNEKVIDDKNNGLKLDAEKILEIILENENDSIEDANQKLQSFLKVFGYALTKKINDDEEFSNKIANSPYVNEDFKANILDSFKNFISDQDSAWTKKVDDAKEKYKKDDYQKKFLEDLEKEFNKKYSSVEDYKPQFIFKNASTAPNNPFTNLNNELISDFAKGIGNIQTIELINNVKTNLIDQIAPLAGFNIDFKNNSKKLSPESAKDPVKRAESWYGQLDNWLKGLRELYKKEDKAEFNRNVDLLIDLINATGGMKIEEWIANQEKATEKLSNVPVSDVEWATLENVNQIFEGDNDTIIMQWSDKLLARLDIKFEENFGVGVTDGQNIIGGTANLTGNRVINDWLGTYITLFKSVPNMKSVDAKNKINGLVSNSQRYFTNKFYEEKKPVAVTEFLVKPWNDDAPIKLKDEIDTAPFIKRGDEKFEGFYNFIKTFITSSIDGETNANAQDQTQNPFKDESNYSWDLLLNMGGKLTNIGTDDPNDVSEWNPGKIWQKFGDNLSLESHNDLLTIDSTSYNDVLKYAVYDFLQNPKPEWNGWTTDNRTDLSRGDYNFNEDPFKDRADQKAKADKLSALIHDLDRNGNNADNKSNDTARDANIYQVLNAKQGIIAYIDEQGMHFVRIEGYPLLTNQTELLREQTRLTKSNDQAMIKNFATHYQLQDNVAPNNNNDQVKNWTSAITNDYLNTNKKAQNSTKIKYSDLNSSFGNKYLEFLINASLLANMQADGSVVKKYGFNLTNEVNSWVSSSATDEDHYWVAIWDYLKEIFGYKNDENSTANAKMFDEFFKAPDKTKNAIGYKIYENYRELILDTLQFNSSASQFNPNKKLASQWTTYEDKYKKMDYNKEIKYNPWNYIHIGENNQKIKTLSESKNWQYELGVQPTLNFNLDLNKYGNFNQQLLITIVEGQGKVN